MTPQTEQELAACIQSASTPLRIVGGGTRQTLGGCSDSDATLSTRALSGITLYEPEALTLIAKAGTPVQEIEATLAAENQHLSFEPMHHQSLLGTIGTPTIGGVVACNVSGSRRIQAGACRDSLIGVRFVDGLGRCLKNGGRVMKNVTGYDLVKLMAGSFGTLGVLSEVAFKVLPKPETSATIVLHDLSEAQGMAALCAALGSPNDVTGAAFEGARALIRIEGFSGSVSGRTQALKSLFKGHEVSVLDTQKTYALWRDVRDVVALGNAQADLWRVSVKPTDGPILTQALAQAGVAYKAQFDWGGGLIWLEVPPATDVRSYMAGLGGYAQCLRGDFTMFAPQNPVLAAIQQGLRTQFDPKSLLNSGMME